MDLMLIWSLFLPYFGCLVVGILSGVWMLIALGALSFLPGLMLFFSYLDYWEYGSREFVSGKRKKWWKIIIQK
jgi:hypothetical protein